MTVTARPWGSGSGIDFPKRYSITKAVRDALYTAGYAPMALTWNRSWIGYNISYEQAQKLVDSINSGKYEQKELLYSKKQLL